MTSGKYIAEYLGKLLLNRHKHKGLEVCGTPLLRQRPSTSFFFRKQDNGVLSARFYKLDPRGRGFALGHRLAVGPGNLGWQETGCWLTPPPYVGVPRLERRFDFFYRKIELDNLVLTLFALMTHFSTCQKTCFRPVHLPISSEHLQIRFPPK